MTRCEGLPGWECGRAVSADGYCIVHGDADTRADRWEAYARPMPHGVIVRLPVADPRQMAMEIDPEPAMPGRMTRATGMATMRTALDSSRWWTAEELAKYLGINMRTVQRWLLNMGRTGYPLEVQRAEDLTDYRYRRSQ